MASLMVPTPSQAQTSITDLAGLNAITANGDYIISADIDAASYTPTLTKAFKGTLTVGTKTDGTFYTISNLSRPLFDTVTDATISNIMLKDVEISQAGLVGAIAGTAKGDSRIYNCGILPNNPGYTDTSTVESTNNHCGSLVGQLEGTARVVNCFSFAIVKAPNANNKIAGGIVGNNNTSGATQDNYATKTIVTNCMFYGDILSGIYKRPVYGGNVIANNASTGINNYNYFRSGASFISGLNTLAKYNNTWAADEKYLNRFEIYRYILNSNRGLTIFWITDHAVGSAVSPQTAVDTALVAKWVLDPTIAPYPILKKWGKYPSIVNIDSLKVLNHETKTNILRTAAKRWEGAKVGTLRVTIQDGDNNNAADVVKNLVVTDMDTLGFDYCAYKVQLPYYNEIFGDPEGATWAEKYGNNYTSKVVTGWKITSVTTDGTIDDYHNFSAHWETGYNFADRHCIDKDLYATSGRVFAQGGYYYVPEGVTAITIEAYWGNAVYLCNNNRYIDCGMWYNSSDKIFYMSDFSIAGQLPTTVGGQTVNTTLSNAVNALTQNSSWTVYDQAIVLVGNYQHKQFNSAITLSGNDYASKARPFTIMSADFDFDNEPDFCFQGGMENGGRINSQPIRFDFLFVPDITMAIRISDSYFGMRIWAPQGHFEITETAFMYTTQFEYDERNANEYKKHEAPMILNGGEFMQIVSSEAFGEASSNATATSRVDATSYFLMGGHVYMKAFTPGCHGNKKIGTRHCAVNAIGGEYPEFYLSGMFRSDFYNMTDNPHAYLDGGKFGLVAGAGMESVGGKNETNGGDVTFKINHSWIREFYGGGINASRPVTGNITTTCDNSIVHKYCGGPKLGDMSNTKLITNNATGSTFGQYYGGGNGGTNNERKRIKDSGGAVSAPNSPTTTSWNGDYGYTAFTPLSSSDGVKAEYATEYEFELLPDTRGTNKVVMRSYSYWATFSRTTVAPIENTITDCTFKGNFYGGGNLGAVGGNVTSTLGGATVVNGSAFGGGFSASIPSFPVHDKSTTEFAYRDASGNIHDGKLDYARYAAATGTHAQGDIIYYQWINDVPAEWGISPAPSVSNPTFEYPASSGNWYCYTTEALTNLGAVSGTTSITVGGTTHIHGNVYGGGDESKVNTNAGVTVQESATIDGNVFGAGKGSENDRDMARVSGNTSVNMSGNTHVKQNVYGGGEMATVGDYTYSSSGHVVTGRTVGGTSGGTTTVNISGGTVGEEASIGTSGQVAAGTHRSEGHTLGHKGHVFGGGLGMAGDSYADYAFVDSASVIINGAYVVGSVFGGGENGHVLHGTSVDMRSGTVGQKLALKERKIDANGAPVYHVFFGNIYGGGRGIDTYGGHYTMTEGRVYGNTHVTISGGTVRHAVYGGGSLASVGTYNLVDANECITDPGDAGYDPDCEPDWKHYYVKGTGDATITMTGGRIGPKTDDLIKDDNGNYLVDLSDGDALAASGFASGQAWMDTNFRYLGANEGSIYGSGRGMSSTEQDNVEYIELAFAQNTTVTVSGGEVIGSVFGGGENGHVKFNTNVTISGTAKIGGIPLHRHHDSHANDYDITENGFWAGDGGKEIKVGVSATDDEQNESDQGNGKLIFRGNVYGGGRGVDHSTTAANTEEVFSTTAGRVYGNTNLTVSGGEVYHNIFGGGSMASVGTYNMSGSGASASPVSARSIYKFKPKSSSVTEVTNEYGYVEANDSYDLEHDGEAVSTGLATVTVTGGIIGRNGFNEGGVYGGCRGLAGAPTWQVTHLAYVDRTHVIIDKVSNEVQADIRGSVFGGGMNGHVLDSTFVNIKAGWIGDSISSGQHISSLNENDTITNHLGVARRQVFRGNVYGGGRGLDPYVGDDSQQHLSATAGRVYGNTHVLIEGGTVFHNVYGGGSIASVGEYDLDGSGNPSALKDGKDPSTCGRAWVEIKGNAVIGSNGRNNGRVFGSSRGMAGLAYRGLGYVNITHVIIDTAMSGGMVLNPTINGSVFGSGENGHTLDSTLVEVKGGTIGNTLTHSDSWVSTYVGNVYGGGRGVDLNTDNHISPSAGWVKNSTCVRISGGHITHNVFGGGSLASVGNYAATGFEDIPVSNRSGRTRVEITGGKIGIDGSNNGRVFGAGRGHAGVVNDSVYLTSAEITALGLSSSDYITHTRRNVAGDADSDYYVLKNVEGGDSVVTYDYTDLTNVTNTIVTINYPTSDANNFITGGVFGSGDNGHVRHDTYVNVLRGTIGSGDGGPVNGNVFGSGRGADMYSSGGEMVYSASAGKVFGSTHVRVTGGIIKNNIYGGGYMATVAGNTYVWTNDSTLGSTPTSPTVWGDIFGGSALGVLGNAEGTTSVNIMGGTIGSTSNGYAAGTKGNVFGGGNGNCEGVGSSGNRAANVLNTVHVNIGATEQQGHDDQGPEILGYVFGCNNVAGSPKNNVYVDVYSTKHNVSNAIPANPATVASETDVLDSSDVHAIVYSGDGGTFNGDVFALKAVYGGGNMADFSTTNTASTIVTIHGCENTIRYVYGGGKAADTKANKVNVEGGLFYQVYGGGDGSADGTRADVEGNAITNIYGGLMCGLFGGSNTRGMVNGTVSITSKDSTTTCDRVINEMYGGGNRALGGSVTITIPCSHNYYPIIFGGAKNADIGTPTQQEDVVLNIEGSTIGKVFGGNNQGGNIYGDVTVNVYGGTIGEVFGGSNEGGNITGTITVNIDSNRTDCPLTVDYVYGGSNLVPYVPDSTCKTTTTPCGGAGHYDSIAYDPNRISPIVNLIQGTVNRDVFGAGKGSSSVDAKVISNPHVYIGIYPARKVCVGRNVYGGGNAASVQGNTHVNVRGTRTKVLGNVYGGGNAGEVSGNTDVQIGGAPTAEP